MGLDAFYSFFATKQEKLNIQKQFMHFAQ